MKIQGISQEQCDRYTETRDTNKGLSQVFDLLQSVFGYTEKEIVKNFKLIYDAISILPSIDGAFDEELESVFKAKLEELDNIYKDYEQKIGTLPIREQRCSEIEHKLKIEKSNLSLRISEVNRKAMFLEDYERQLKEENERLKEEILKFESPEMRDRARLAELYLSKVDVDNKWTEKAIAWSLGAIYSGKQLPNFGKGEE